jgi:hypothetical protein
VCPFWDCLDRLTVDRVAASVGHVAKTPVGLTVLHI